MSTECSEKGLLEKQIEQERDATLEPASRCIFRQRRTSKQKLFCALQVLTCILLWVFVSAMINVGANLAPRLHRTTIERSKTLFDNQALFIEGVNENTLCSRLMIDINNEDEASTASISLYSLSRPPSLDGYNNLTANSTRSAEALEVFTFWNGYLHSGSEVQLSVCTENEQPVDVMFFNSTDNYRAWQNAPQSPELAFSVTTVNTLCPNMQQVTVVTPNGSSNQWYIVIRNALPNETTVRINADILEKVYTFMDEDIRNFCQASSQRNCELPTSRGAIYVVTNVQPPTFQGSQSTEVDVICIAGGWLFAAVLLPCAGLLLVGVFFFVLAYCYLRKRSCKQCSALKCRSNVNPGLGQEGVEDGKATTLAGHQPHAVPKNMYHY